MVVLQDARPSAPLPRRNPPRPGSVRSLPAAALIFASPSGRSSSKISLMHRRGRLPSFLFAFVVAAAWGVSNGTHALASTGVSAAPAPGEQPVGPDSTAASPDSAAT